MSKQRITIDTLQSGQPRPYADSVRHVRVTFEYFRSWLGNDNDPRSKWEPQTYWTEEEVRKCLRTLKCGFTDEPMKDWASPNLHWLKNPEPGVWEFMLTEAFTD